MKLKYYNNLDGIRAIAVLMVMIFHFFPAVNEGTLLPFLKKISIFGQTGVTLFFVLSGFLITRILINTKHKNNYFLNFYMRRFLRIFPLYYFFLVLSYYIFPIILNLKIPSFSQQIYYFTYLQNFAMTFHWDSIGPGHFWSLAVEEHFYIFWPILVYFLSISKLKKTIYFIIFFAFVLRIVFVINNLNVFYFTFTRIDALAIGSLLAVFEKKEYIKQTNAIKFLSVLIISVIMLAILGVSFPEKGNNIVQITKFLFLATLYFGLLGYLISINKENIVNRILRSHFFSFTGKISYGLYVYHPISLVFFVHFFYGYSILITILGSFLISYLLSTVSYYILEKSFLKLKRYFK